MVDRVRGMVVTKKECGKVTLKNGFGEEAYSLRSAKKSKKRVKAEGLDSLQKQSIVRSKVEQISSTSKRKLTVSSIGGVNNRKVLVTPSVRTYFRVLPGSPKMSTRDEGMQDVDKLVPVVGLEDKVLDTRVDRGGTAQFSPPWGSSETQEGIGARQDVQPLGENHGQSIADMLKALSVD
ncbi:hypothetical protein NDU88_003511 [Pleurodeles waltl]|uniref:Uncharacterized protein n=1 Tax=Pleurodeles waltl TaxID=8319 RepID=A0AAV7TNL7_PLEWA|nr:hypothetical protein NDU88_003511 [Pleurodeles waltl]